MLAQSIADREGPDVSIRATMSSNVGSRAVRASFHTQDDAYVVVGHIDPDGVLRIVFPTNASDDGFVKGDHSYQTSEFFAGFNDQYNFRYRSAGLYRSAAAANDSYDRGLGYVFIIATWRPMRFDRFSTDGKWDSFELADQDYMRDPRPAVYELASLLSGENREAYTVKFAQYYNTQTLYSGYDSFGFANEFGTGYCPGYAPIGFGSSPFDVGSSLNQWYILNGYNFWYRGTYYSYDRGLGCYRQGAGVTFFNPFGIIAQAPIIPGTRPGRFNPANAHPPIVPPPGVKKVHAVLETPTPGASDATARHFSPAYRQRGLITDEAEPRIPTRRPVQAAGETPEGRTTRPGFSEMVNRREQNGNEGTPTYRSRARVDGGSNAGSNGWSAPSRVRESPGASNGSSNGSESRARFNPSDSPHSAPVTREASPRFEAPAHVSSPPPSSPPHVEAPRVSSPPPSSPPPASSSSTGKPPGKG